MSELSPARQLPLSLPHEPGLTRDEFVVGAPNRAAYEIATEPGRWPGPVVAISGPAGSGKSHLAAILACEHGAPRVRAADLAGIDPPDLISRGLAIVEDGSEVAGEEALEKRLFHLLNLAAEQGGRVLLTGRTRPGEWPVALRDLASRLRAVPGVAIGAPDDDLLAQILVKLFADRQITVEPGLVTYLIHRMERSCAAAVSLVDALDAEAMARGRPLTRALAASVLAPTVGGRKR